MEYLYQLPDALGVYYFELLGADTTQLSERGREERHVEQVDDRSDEIERDILSRTDIGPTERRGLALSRRGQGYFKKRVAEFEPGCRITGLTEKTHLRASHIKPWNVCDDVDRLDGANGLLLSPHVDHLFDRGFISFKKDGAIIRSTSLSDAVVTRWHLDLISSAGSFTRRQDRFLEFHRDSILKH
jgi:hypothetical protein